MWTLYKYWAKLRRHSCGVSVNMQRKFQQSMPIDIEVPQILFIARVLDIPVMPLRRARTVQTLQKMRIPQRSSWEGS